MQNCDETSKSVRSVTECKRYKHLQELNTEEFPAYCVLKNRSYWIFVDVGNEENYEAEKKIIQEVTNPIQKL